jgi:hypothetical protein
MANNNFEKAKQLTANWPSWKREYQLTKPVKAKDETERMAASSQKK